MGFREVPVFEVRDPKYRELTHMPGSPTTPDQADARDDAPRLFCLPQRRQRRHPE